MNNNNIYISVVLCTYNDEKYIRKSIESILNQTYRYFELIIIDDGSTDNTNKIIKEFNDSRIKFIEKKNTGLIDSLNYGFSICKYEWVARMDGDDIAFSNRFETQIKYISEDVAVIGSQIVYIDENDNIIGKTHIPVNHKEILKRVLNIRAPIVHPTVMIKKELFHKIGGYDMYIRHSEDYDLWLQHSLSIW